MRAIKEELGDNDDEDDDVAGLEKKMQAARMPPNVWKHAQRELRSTFYEIYMMELSWFFLLICFLFFNHCRLCDCI